MIGSLHFLYFTQTTKTHFIKALQKLLDFYHFGKLNIKSGNPGVCNLKVALAG
jgi:hypothetical protein